MVGFLLRPRLDFSAATVPDFCTAALRNSADDAGRPIAFPLQVQAGLIASLCSGPYLLPMQRSAVQQD